MKKEFTKNEHGFMSWVQLKCPLDDLVCLGESKKDQRENRLKTFHNQCQNFVIQSGFECLLYSLLT